jgi:hypothetical protein
VKLGQRLEFSRSDWVVTNSYSPQYHLPQTTSDLRSNYPSVLDYFDIRPSLISHQGYRTGLKDLVPGIVRSTIEEFFLQFSSS